MNQFTGERFGDCKGNWYVLCFENKQVRMYCLCAVRILRSDFSVVFKAYAWGKTRCLSGSGSSAMHSRITAIIFQAGTAADILRTGR
jgi:hypothetical protein